MKNNKRNLFRLIAFWAATAIILTETAAGAGWDIFQIPFVLDIMKELGYPAYFLVILGVWKVLAVIALLPPGFARAKEWAYAGLFFTYTGAAISHLAMHDTDKAWGPLIFAGLTVVSWALRPASRRLNMTPAPVEEHRSSKSKIVGYWVTTGIIEFVVLSGGLADLFQRGATVDGMLHLGYPLYFVILLGAWKVLAGIALLVPRFPLLKEWAYAGVIFNMTGAVASHIVMGDEAARIIWPLFFAGCAMMSWALRPASRRIAAQGKQKMGTQGRTISYIDGPSVPCVP